MSYEPATKPTLYFIGVTTGQSSIMRVFPEWATFLNLGDVAIKGMDFPLHAAPETYREAVAFIKNDPLSMGALVTTHKLDLYAACKDQFDIIDTHAEQMTEVSCISKRGEHLACDAKDPVSSGLSIDALLPEGFFSQSNGALCCLGAGGSSIAITWHLLQQQRGSNRPSRIVVSDPSKPRLDHIKRYHEHIGATIPIDYIVVSPAHSNDQIVTQLPANSFVINATGLGKDAPGSPLSNQALLPERSVVWDLNYRGDLIFLDQARAQQKNRSLQVQDGWTYFLHGWTQVIAEVFHITIPTDGADFDQLSNIALNVGKPSNA